MPWCNKCGEHEITVDCGLCDNCFKKSSTVSIKKSEFILLKKIEKAWQKVIDAYKNYVIPDSLDNEVVYVLEDAINEMHPKLIKKWNDDYENKTGDFTEEE